MLPRSLGTQPSPSRRSASSAVRACGVTEVARNSRDTPFARGISIETDSDSAPLRERGPFLAPVADPWNPERKDRKPVTASEHAQREHVKRALHKSYRGLRGVGSKLLRAERPERSAAGRQHPTGLRLAMAIPRPESRALAFVESAGRVQQHFFTILSVGLETSQLVVLPPAMHGRPEVELRTWVRTRRQEAIAYREAVRERNLEKYGTTFPPDSE